MNCIAYTSVPKGYPLQRLRGRLARRRFRRGEFKRLKAPQNEEHDTHTKKGKQSLVIFLTLYQHLGPKDAKFCVL